ncbi:MAG TPA: glycoside hydrolase family 38 C-terminal domain-containing protein [Pyrinomonadaceae bacterium]|nr:glycoside hydrolase family 38 C-terminal domain-containing protein [Pyrinomonadaceae bacterium]
MRRSVLRGLMLSLVFTVNAVAQVRTAWKIGDFDGSSAEFRYGEATASRTFVVSENRPKDWPYVQTAVLPGKSGEAAPQTIRFELPGAPQGVYMLRLGLIMKTPRAPVIQVDVNGHQGWFHRRPVMDQRLGNNEPSSLPQHASGTLTVEIPAEFLRQGRNQISLTAIADPLSTALPGGETIVDAALTWDALALDQDPRARGAAGVLSASATPTVFYKNQDGRLAEVVSVLVRWNKLAPQGSVTLALPGWNATQPLASERQFGEQRLEFLVPEFPARTKASITVTANGRSYRFTQLLQPARKWTIYMVPHEHLDVGYSDFQTKLTELHSRVIDEAIEMSREHPEFSFTLDGYWQARQFLDGRTQAEKEKFFAAVRDKKVFVPAQDSVLLTGFPTAETLLRSFYDSHKLNRAHGGPWDHANITDVPSYSWSYASIMAAAGLKYFAAAANEDRGPTLLLGDLHLRSPFWWEGPDGGRVLMWYARHYHQLGSQFGLPPSVATGYEGLQSFLEMYDRPDYKSNAVMLYGSQWENTSLYPQQAGLAQQWNSLFAFPELRFSGFGEAIEKIAGSSKDDLPVIRGDGGPYWEDGIASDAYYAAMERENERRALSAEKLSTVAALVDSRFQPSRAALDCAWQNILLMNEHTWGWGRSVTEPHSEDSVRELQYKQTRAVIGRDCLEYLLDRAMTAITGRIETPARALVVFNSLNWARNGWVEFDLQKTRELVDVLTRQTVKFEVLRDEKAYQRIRFMARDVPAMGYRIYAVQEKNASATASSSDATQAAAGDPPQSQAPSGTLENSFYRVVLDPQSGAVRSIYDKQLGRELVDGTSPYRFNQYVYVTGGDEFPNQLLLFNRGFPLAQLKTQTAVGGRVVSVSKTPYGVVARLESKALNTPQISTEIILFDDEKKIEFINRVRKDEVYTREGIYFAFPLAVREPQFSYEVQTGVVDPARDMIPGAGLEWFSSQNWVSVSEPGVAISLINKDSFLWTFGDIVRGTWPTEFGKRRATIFSYVMNNYWSTNYRAAQGGEFTFRYVLASADKLDQPALSRMGWEETTPLERTLVKAQDKAAPVKNPLPASMTSFLQVSGPSVVLSTWKQAEDGEGTILRFIELGGERAQVSVNSPLLKSASAQSCNAVEECGQPLSGGENGFSFGIGPRQIFTMKVNAPRAQDQ